MNSLKLLRKAAGLSQTDLAKILNVTQGAVSQWEQGIVKPRADLLPLIAKTLKCTIDNLLINKNAI